MTDPQPNTTNASAFPSTQETWIGRKLMEGKSGHSEVVQHVMAVYAQPLVAYLRGSSFHGAGDPDDIVTGFLADRLDRNGFLREWLLSRRQLRYWLIVAFKHYLLEQSRGTRRDGEIPRRVAETTNSQPAAPAAEREYHRRMALMLVRESLRMAEQSCREAGLDEHWQVFVQHHHAGRRYEDISAETGIDVRRLVVMARTASNHVRTSVRKLVAWEGADDEAIDEEIRSLMEVIQS